jgi:type II secretory pathway component GspD/PulD (secretin)
MLCMVAVTGRCSAQLPALPVPNGGHSIGGIKPVRLMPPVNVPPIPQFEANNIISQEPSPLSEAGMSDGISDLQWSFNFQDAPWPVVIRNLSKQFGFSIDFVETPSSTLTYFDSNSYTVDAALDILNDHLLKEGFIIIRNEQNLTVINASNQIPDNLIPFVGIHDLVRLGRNEVATVAFPVRNTDPNMAVVEVEQLISPLGRVKPLSDSSRVIVTDTGSYLRRIADLLLERGVGQKFVESVVYQLSHASSEEVANSINEFLSGKSQQGGSGASSGSSNGLHSNRVVSEPTTNSLLVRGTPDEIAAMTSIIQELDRGPREVVVQAVLVEVQLGNTHELGVELGFQDSVLFDRSVIDNLVTITETTTNPLGVATTNQRIISQTAAPGFNFNNQPLGNNTAISPSTIGSQGLSSFGVGRVNGDLGFGGLVLSAGSDSVNVLLRALDANFDIDILSRPQIRTVENHEALIQIGQQVPVVDGVSVTAVGSANPVIRQEQAGIILRVTPRISPSGRIVVDVDAEKSAFNLTPGTGVPIFTDATNGNVIEAPVKEITTANTTVSVQSGQTIVLGGMITNANQTVNRKVPWLGDLPVIGKAFRWDLNSMARTELLVLLTPIQVSDDVHSDLLAHQEVSRIHMPASAWEFNDNVFGTAVTPTGSQEFRIGALSPAGKKGGTSGRTASLSPNRDSAVTPALGSSGASQQPENASGTTVSPAGYQQNPASSSEVHRTSLRPENHRQWKRRPSYRGHFTGQIEELP